MNPPPLGLGILGCGDFLRWNAEALQTSTRARVVALFDPAADRAARWAERLGCGARASAAEVIEDPAVDVVLAWMPPFVREDALRRAFAAGKAVLATKPLAHDEAACARIEAAARAAGRPFGILYGRSGDVFVPALAALLRSGELGALALYRRDWQHAAPAWNTWATDPALNGGPFLDAMIHNLNAARHLMGRPVRQATFFGANLAHPQLRCADTETMLVEFERGQALLFITWAADLAVHSTAGNDREHIDVHYLVTDQGWRLETAWTPAGPLVRASRGGTLREFPVKADPETVFDAFARHCRGEAPLLERLATPAEAAEDVRLIRRGMAALGTAVVPA